MLRALARRLVPAHLRPRQVAMRRLIENSRLEVVSGPFRGMRYPPPEAGDWFFPQLLGSYELELASAIEEIASSPTARTVLLLGAAEGYYAVGLARRAKQLRIVAFEASPRRRAQLQSIAALNDVSIDVRGTCDVVALRDALEVSTLPFVLVDIEGGEGLLLDPRVVPALAQAELLVEVHDFFLPGVGATLTARFSGTHDISRIEAAPRRPVDFPAALPLSRAGRSRAELSLMDEGRPAGSYWLHFRTQRAAGAA